MPTASHPLHLTHVKAVWGFSDLSDFLGYTESSSHGGFVDRIRLGCGRGESIVCHSDVVKRFCGLVSDVWSVDWKSWLVVRCN
jgi:hypothetical protein